jgi:hypothetical protein
MLRTSAMEISDRNLLDTTSRQIHMPFWIGLETLLLWRKLRQIILSIKESYFYPPLFIKNYKEKLKLKITILNRMIFMHLD